MIYKVGKKLLTINNILKNKQKLVFSCLKNFNKSPTKLIKNVTI